MKKILKFLFLGFIFSANYAFAGVQGIAVVVGDHVITEYQLDQKIRFIMFGQQMKKTNDIKDLYPYFMNAVIDNDLIVSNLRQRGNKIDKLDIENALKYMAKSRNTTTDNILKTAQEYGISKEYFIEMLEDDILFQAMFINSLMSEVRISDEELSNEIQKHNVDAKDETAVNQLKVLFAQQKAQQKAKDLIQTIRQSTFIEIKLKNQH